MPSTDHFLPDQLLATIRNKSPEEAYRLCEKMLPDHPGNSELQFIMGILLASLNRWESAVHNFQEASRLSPGNAAISTNLAVALLQTGRSAEALEAVEDAVRSDSYYPLAHYNRGVILQQFKRYQEAIRSYELALSQNPGHINSWINLTAVKLMTGDNKGAINSCLEALSYASDNDSIVGNLASALTNEHRYEEALIQYERLLELAPETMRAEALGRMANTYCYSGMVNKGIECFTQAMDCAVSQEQKRNLASSRLFVLHYSDKWSPEDIAAEHRTWGKTYFAPAIRRFAPKPYHKPLRVAYISPDFKIHAVVFFTQPVLAAHNPSGISVYCYSDVEKPDMVTEAIKEQHGVIWRDVAGLDNDIVATMLHEDEIDILVDLAGHSALNRLPLFASRAAPVQVTWIGYPNTTGLTEMDFRLTDAKADPTGLTDHFHTEELVRLPNSFLCYRPGGDFPAESPLPLLSNKFVTFGSFSNFTKVTDQMLSLWAEILAQVPNSRLLFRARGMSPERFNREIAPIFERNGVSPDRVAVLGHARSVVENLSDYSRIDIALDTFPYCGTTTTCESLYMGVPVITLAGRSHVSRVGVSLLETVGLTELIAESAEQYKSLAISLSGDLKRLLLLRKSLRQQLLDSPLTDNVSFARDLESAYRWMWERKMGRVSGS